MSREKIVVYNKRSGRYIIGVKNGKIITSPKLGEAWLMYTCEWIKLTIDHKLEDNRYGKIWVTLRR